jgi:hypothetical protein
MLGAFYPSGVVYANYIAAIDQMNAMGYAQSHPQTELLLVS